jgi:RNA polymerase sigma-70 factor (ECF subfamily)
MQSVATNVKGGAGTGGGTCAGGAAGAGPGPGAATGPGAGMCSGAGPGRLSQAAALAPQMLRLEHLARAMAAGDPGALSSIYDETVAQVFAIARAMLRCKEDAEEIVCDVYTHAWQRASTYDSGRGTVMAWLAVMTRNRAVDRLRQRRATMSLDDDRHGALGASLVGDALSPEQMLVQFQSRSAVHRALKSLDPKRRYLLGLAFFRGLSHQEIAAATGIPLGTVKSHVRRALSALQDEITVDV